MTGASTVTSPDGTVIDYDRYGDGPAVIFIGGATAYRAIDEGTTQTARRLAAERYTAIDYERRGRGRSGDTWEYRVIIARSGSREQELVVIADRPPSYGTGCVASTCAATAAGSRWSVWLDTLATDMLVN